MIDFAKPMAELAQSPVWQIHSEARGAHWVAWASHEGAKPVRSVVVVGQTREEAEAHARIWADSFLAPDQQPSLG
jgi:hypothetical protein